MSVGPLVGAAGMLLLLRIGTPVDYVGEVLPGLLVFSLGLSMTVAPLTAAVLAGAQHQAGIASGVNNAVARVAGPPGAAAGRPAGGAFVGPADRPPPPPPPPPGGAAQGPAPAHPVGPGGP